MVTSADKWPVGLDRRRPRVPQNPAVAALVGGTVGALLGAVFTERQRDVAENAALGGSAGLVVGGLVGTVGRPLSLDYSLRLALKKIGVSFVSLRYHGRYEARLVFETKRDGFKVVVAHADPNRMWLDEELDDWLYMMLVGCVLDKVESDS